MGSNNKREMTDLIQLTPKIPVLTREELPTDFFVLFNDDSNKRITTEQADMLMQASGTAAKFIKLDGMLINFSNIARVITVKEYYDQFPDKRPVTLYKKQDRATDTGVNSRKTFFDSEAWIVKALNIWKRQRSAPNFVNITGGLDRLIANYEQKLSLIKNARLKKVECHASVGLSKSPEYKAKRLAEIRARRKYKCTGMQSIVDIL